MADESQDGQEVQDTGMPEGEQAAPPEDPVKNLKSEVSRKFENLNSQFAQLNQSLQALANQKQQQQAALPEKSIKELIYDDPDQAAEIITQRAVARADEIISSKNQVQQAMQQRVMSLTNEYPEFANANSEATKIATREHANLPRHLQNTPEGAELALQRAAAQLGLTPSSRRRRPAGNDDSYVPPSKGSARGQAPTKETELNDEQFTFAHILNESIGRKFDEKNLKKYAGRKTWNKFSGGEES